MRDRARTHTGKYGDSAPIMKYRVAITQISKISQQYTACTAYAHDTRGTYTTLDTGWSVLITE